MVPGQYSATFLLCSLFLLKYNHKSAEVSSYFAELSYALLIYIFLISYVSFLLIARIKDPPNTVPYPECLLQTHLIV